MEINIIDEIKKVKEIIEPEVEKRYSEFKKLGKSKDEKELYSELSFCMMTANWTAKGGIKAQKYIGKENFAGLDYDDMLLKLKEVGHRFPNMRSKFIVENRWVMKELYQLVQGNTFESRKYIVKNIKGIGWKEASHFLRNTGHERLAILDKHILRLLMKSGYISELPKNGWNEKKYTFYENIIFEISDKIGEIPGKMDLYMWYIAKGSVDK